MKEGGGEGRKRSSRCLRAQQRTGLFRKTTAPNDFTAGGKDASVPFLSGQEVVWEWANR